VAGFQLCVVKTDYQLSIVITNYQLVTAYFGSGEEEGSNVWE
jgi:hypothetical protein